jgi:hypothetical protein
MERAAVRGRLNWQTGTVAELVTETVHGCPLRIVDGPSRGWSCCPLPRPRRPGAATRADPACRPGRPRAHPGSHRTTVCSCLRRSPCASGASTSSSIRRRSPPPSSTSTPQRRLRTLPLALVRGRSIERRPVGIVEHKPFRNDPLQYATESCLLPPIGVAQISMDRTSLRLSIAFRTDSPCVHFRPVCFGRPPRVDYASRRVSSGRVLRDQSAGAPCTCRGRHSRCGSGAGSVWRVK